jgi:tetratricopeptide (TPR) repeat protein
VKAGAGAAFAAAGACLAACASTQSLPPPPGSAAYADFLVGRVANLTDDYQAACERYMAALMRSPRNQDLVDGAVTSALAAGDIDHAREAARYARGEDGPAYAHLVAAADALVAQRWSLASTELRAANSGAAPGLTARMLQVWAQAGQHRVEDVDPDLRPLLTIRPYGGLLRYQQAMALDYVGRGPDALSAYAEASGLGMWLPPAVERHADLLARQGARDQALQLLTLPANQGNPELAAGAGRLQAGQAIALRPLTPALGGADALYGLAAIYLQESDPTDALATLTLTLMLDPSFDPARLAFAQAQSDLHHGDLARAMLHQVNAGSAYASSAGTMEAWTLVADGRLDEAIAMARAAAVGGDPRAKRALADIYRQSHHDGEAEAIYSELIAAGPPDWRLFFARGAARMRLRRFEEGEGDLRHALQLAPEQPEVMNYLGYSWVDRGEHLAEGLAMIQRAVVLRPDTPAFVDSLGWAYYRMHDYPEALENLEHAVELESGDPTLNDHLGDVYWRAGRRIEARYQWRRVLSLAPADPAAVQNKIDRGLPPEGAERAARQ